MEVQRKLSLKEFLLGILVNSEQKEGGQQLPNFGDDERDISGFRFRFRSRFRFKSENVRVREAFS